MTVSAGEERAGLGPRLLDDVESLDRFGTKAGGGAIDQRLGESDPADLAVEGKIGRAHV